MVHGVYWRVFRLAGGGKSRCVPHARAGLNPRAQDTKPLRG